LETVCFKFYKTVFFYGSPFARWKNKHLSLPVKNFPPGSDQQAALWQDTPISNGQSMAAAKNN
jgi:hypothetical protein